MHLDPHRPPPRPIDWRELSIAVGILTAAAIVGAALNYWNWP